MLKSDGLSFDHLRAEGRLHMIPIFGSAGSKSEKIKIDLIRSTGQHFKTLVVRKGANLWVSLRRFGVPVGASCSGVGVCGKCGVEIKSSTHNSVSAATELEQHTRERQGLSNEVRLACLCRVMEDVTISADYW